MDIIHLLPDSVANQIAAGEVVQRPSSVIKELMENAVDAGASHIDVVITDAGRTSIQVIDDGKGMTQTDARLAFERHATSKIRRVEDLFTLHTMGFRGEALPSIAAVSQVRLKTRVADSELGVSLSIDGSEVVSQEMCSCPVGCNFEVRNLFYNVPVRRKFLKSNQTEMNNIVQEYERVALVNPDISFSLTHGDTLLSKLERGTQRSRVVSVFGKRLDSQLLDVHVETSLANIKGFVGKPEAARKKNAAQYFFVNGRYMRHPYFHKAVMEAFNHLIPEGEQIPYFLFFDIDPANVDVNIHPTKTEVKFENESAIWQIIVAAVRDTLGRFNAIPTIDFDVEGRPDIPVFDTEGLSSVQAPQVQVDVTYNPFHSQPRQQAPVDWQALYEGLDQAHAAPAPEIPDEQPQDNLFGDEELDTADRSVEHFQFRGQYILTAVQSGLMIVDQHRAHVRVLYDKYMRQMESKNTTGQRLLFPEMITVSPSDSVILQHITDDLMLMGFDISDLGGGSYSIQAVPADLGEMNPVPVLTLMIETAKEKDTGMEHEMRHRLALVMARSTAVVTGQLLSMQEMDSLINDLFQCANPNLTPTGKTIVSIVQQAQIEKLFG